MKKHTYINIDTGEVVDCNSIIGARRYFKRDAKRFGYHYKRRSIIRLRKAYKKGLV